MPANVNALIEEFESLQGSRHTWESHWSAVARKIWPEADQFHGSRFEPGSARRQEIYSSHGSRALRKWVSVMMSQMVPKTEQWQQLRSTNPDLNKDPEVKRFFEELTRLLFEVRNAPDSSFYETMIPTFSCIGAFGNGCFFMDDMPSGGVRYIPIPLQMVWIAVDHYKRVNGVFYRWEMTAQAAMAKWGKIWGDSPPRSIKNALDQNDHAKLRFLHCVKPREDPDPYALGPEAMPWQSVYILLDDHELIEEKGYEELPYIFSRDMVEAHEIYGRGAGMMVLPELGSVNVMRRLFLRAGERVVAPPLLLHDDEFSLGAKTVKLMADGLNFGAVSREGRPMIQPLQTGARLDISQEMIRAEEDAISDAFGLNLFRILLDDPRPDVTATEVLQRAQEKGELIAPSINARQGETFGPETERLIGVLSRQGRTPPIPHALAEARGEYRIEYSSPANRLQRSGELNAVQQTMQLILPLAQVDPSILMKFKGGEIVDRAMEILGGPSDVLMTQDEFEAMKEQMAQQQQQQAAMEQAPGMAQAMNQGAQAAETMQRVDQ